MLKKTGSLFILKNLVTIEPILPNDLGWRDICCRRESLVYATNCSSAAP